MITACVLGAGGLPHSTRDACENILAAIQRSNVAGTTSAKAPCDSDKDPAVQSDEEEEHVNLDHILSKVPYKVRMACSLHSPSLLQFNG